MACSSVNDGPKVGKGQKQADGLLERDDYSSLTILDSLTIRSKLQNGDVFSMSIIEGSNDTVFITLTEVSPTIYDKSWLYKGDGEYSNGIFSVPFGPGTYWKVYFTDDSIPHVQSGGGQYERLDCICTNGGSSNQLNQCGIIQDNTGDGVLRYCCDGLCDASGPEGQQSGCAPEKSNVPFVLIKAEVLVIGNEIYTD